MEINPVGFYLIGVKCLRWESKCSNKGIIYICTLCTWNKKVDKVFFFNFAATAYIRICLLLGWLLLSERPTLLIYIYYAIINPLLWSKRTNIRFRVTKCQDLSCFYLLKTCNKSKNSCRFFNQVVLWNYECLRVHKNPENIKLLF